MSWPTIGIAACPPPRGSVGQAALLQGWGRGAPPLEVEILQGSRRDNCRPARRPAGPPAHTHARPHARTHTARPRGRAGRCRRNGGGARRRRGGIGGAGVGGGCGRAVAGALRGTGRGARRRGGARPNGGMKRGWGAGEGEGGGGWGGGGGFVGASACVCVRACVCCVVCAVGFVGVCGCAGACGCARARVRGCARAWQRPLPGWVGGWGRWGGVGAGAVVEAGLGGRHAPAERAACFARARRRKSPARGARGSTQDDSGGECRVPCACPCPVLAGPAARAAAGPVGQLRLRPGAPAFSLSPSLSLSLLLALPPPLAPWVTWCSLLGTRRDIDPNKSPSNWRK